jgi:hypothetical protein
VALLSGATTVTGVSAGAARLTASFYNAAGSTTVTVADEPAYATRVTLSYPSTTLAGAVGATAAGAVAVEFADGTSYSNAATQYGQRDALSSLLAFSSDDEPSLTVTAGGIASLAANSYRLAVLRAAAVCTFNASAQPSNSFLLAGNLAPAVNDTKLGSLTGLTFPPASAGGSISIPVYVNSGAAPLVAWQMSFSYDTTLFGTPSIAVGVGWLNYLFASNIPRAGLGVMAGVAAVSSAIGVSRVATITLPVITSSAVVAPLTANVEVLTTMDGQIITSATPVVSGSAYVVLNGGTTLLPQGRRLLSAPDNSRRLQILTGEAKVDGKRNATDV